MAKPRQDSFLKLADIPVVDKLSRPAALREIGTVVYAIRVGDLIKIGHTSNLAARCRSLGSSDVLAFAAGTHEDEQNLHSQLRKHLHHGREWYYPTPAVMTVINEMRARLGLEPIA